MKPYIKLFLFSIISLIAVSCRNSEGKSTIDGTDSIQEEVFTSPDLTLFQLKGHVKKCIVPGDDMGDFVYEFDENGSLVSPKYEKIERDKNGAIIEYYNPETECTTRIKWGDGKVIGQTDMFGDSYNSSSIGYEYDNENNIIQLVQEGIAFPTNYSNYKFDEFGNWISRTQESNGTSCEERRYITYYGSDTGQERLLEYYKQKKEEKKQREQEQKRLEEERRQEEISQYPEKTFNQLLGNTVWRCLGHSWNGYYQTMKKEDAEYVVSFRPINDLSGHASFVKWAGHNVHRSYAEKPSQDDYKYAIKGDIIELKNSYPEVEMSFKIDYQDGKIILRSLDYVENGVFTPISKDVSLFPDGFKI